jgi:hypothetical protein
MTKNNVAHLRATDTTHRELSWFAQQIERGRSGPFCDVVTITPKIAERMLERNECNRPMSNLQIEEIASDIRNGYWQLNGETIILSKDGELNDGQNRLAAIAATNMAVPCFVAFGIDRASRMTVDMGRQRTTGNFLAMDGTKDANHVAAAVALHSLYKAGVYGRNAKTGRRLYFSKQEILENYHKNKKAYDAAVDFARTDKFSRSCGVSNIAAAHVILTAINSAESAIFFQRLIDGVRLDRGNPILWLRSRLMQTGERLQAHEKLELTLRYWNAFREGKTLSRGLQKVGAYPKVAR